MVQSLTEAMMNMQLDDCAVVEAQSSGCKERLANGASASKQSRLDNEASASTPA